MDGLKIKVAESFLRYKCYRHQVSWDEKLDFEEKIRMALQNRIEIINFLCLGFIDASNNLFLKNP